MTRTRTRYLILGAIAALLLSCASSTPARFYTLMGDSGAEAPDITAGTQLLLVGPVELADHLDRPQMVLQGGEHELRLEEFHRWAGSVREEVERLLVGALDEALTPQEMRAVDWAPGRTEPAARGRLALEVLRMEGPLGGEVQVELDWTLLNASGGVLGRGTVTVSERAGDPSHAAYAAACSAALWSAARELADRIGGAGILPQPGPA